MGVLPPRKAFWSYDYLHLLLIKAVIKKKHDKVLELVYLISPKFNVRKKIADRCHNNKFHRIHSAAAVTSMGV